MNIEKARDFVRRTARPLELALYQYYFENGGPGDVVSELKAYQNPDGGFGHALEPDNWNPASTPVTVNDALFTLYRVGGLDGESELVRGMLDYLRSGDGFDPALRRWRFAVESNLGHPHAIWWEPRDGGVLGFNPTVSLAAFMLCFGGRDAGLEGTLREAAAFLEANPEDLADTIKDYMLAWELLNAHGIRDVVDLDALKATITRRAEEAICKDVSKYGVEYVTLPSDLFAFGFRRFLSPEIERWIGVEIAALSKLQMADGGFDISWQWHTPYPEAFEQARIWWRARLTIDKLGFVELGMRSEE